MPIFPPFSTAQPLRQGPPCGSKSSATAPRPQFESPTALVPHATGACHPRLSSQPLQHSHIKSFHLCVSPQLPSKHQLRPIGMRTTNITSPCILVFAAGRAARAAGAAIEAAAANFSDESSSKEIRSTPQNDKARHYDGYQTQRSAQTQPRPNPEPGRNKPDDPDSTAAWAKAQAPVNSPGEDSGGGGDGGGNGRGSGNGGNYILNYGTAVRVLREDLPQILERPLHWDIYRRDLCFITPWVGPLRGLKQYQMMHGAMRALAKLLFRCTTVELLRLWIPIIGPPAVRGGAGGSGGTTSSQLKGTEASDNGGKSSGDGGGEDAAGGDGGGGERFGGGQLRVRWRVTGQPWLPWSEEQRLEVVATYRFDRHGLIAIHELNTIIPPEPPLLVWPLLVVAQLLGGIKGPQGAVRGRMPIPGAGAGYRMF